MTKLLYNVLESRALDCSNGMLDPWMSGGIIYDINESVVSAIILDGAHHLDLRQALFLNTWLWTHALIMSGDVLDMQRGQSGFLPVAKNGDISFIGLFLKGKGPCFEKPKR